MRLVILVSLFYMPATFATLKEFASENCEYSHIKDRYDGKYDKLLSYLDKKGVENKNKRRQYKDRPTGQR